MSLENDNEKMEKDADKYFGCKHKQQTKKTKTYIQLLITGNKLWKAVQVKIAKIKPLEAEIQNLEKKLKEMPANWVVLSFS